MDEIIRATINGKVTHFYSAWSNMKQRCRRRPEYTGKGITVCREWNSFENFYKDMFDGYDKHVELYGKTDTTLERIDNSKGYSSENCKWIRKGEQVYNRSRCKNEVNYIAISPDGKIHSGKSLYSLCREHNLDRRTVYHILNGKGKTLHGWRFTRKEEITK